MKKTALVLALLTLPVFADTHVYECEMFVVEAKNGLIRNAVKANYGAMVVDRGEQFYVVRDDRVLSSPFLTKRNGELSGWICPYISRHLLSLNPLLACCRRYSR
uniref:hypothetical protein n=2 Tax=Escherichia coli TaxID=562 RepID=UPI0020366D58